MSWRVLPTGSCDEISMTDPAAREGKKSVAALTTESGSARSELSTGVS